MRGHGGTGRHAALRMLWSNPWGFKSPWPHQNTCKKPLAGKSILLLQFYPRMKGFRVFLTCIVAMSGFSHVYADDADVVRGAIRRGTNTTVQSTRPQTTTTHISGGRTTTQPGARVQTTRATTTITSRDTTHVTNRATTTTPAVLPRGAITQSNLTRAASRSTKPRATIQSRATTQRLTSPLPTATRVRAATTATTNRSDIISHDYKTCRDIYYECMDEFCANKDSQLKRCACSSRTHEFDRTKQSLDAADEKLLDFNQRLLSVNMDREDVAALNVATAGENAYYESKDTSASKRALDEIAKKLNTKFDTGNFNTSLSALSWSLNADAAFDSVDSLSGASTTAKSGVALYNAALPVCHEMAAEVCSDTDLDIAESGYQMIIEQDCNTVKKTYQVAADTAREKIREGSALLDMSRLDIYQTRNSDDILTCKRKMLDMLTDTSVCGPQLGKCLDMTGQYIDPTTGAAILSDKLVNLGGLITRPTNDATWSGMSGNEKFVSYLRSKEKFLSPATENCQDISDYVWDAFIEDALAQIKLAQEAKLEQMRQGCTTLTTQCLSDANDSIADFDARALSIFGVAADKTVNAMCADIKNACTTLMQYTPDNTSNTNEWIAGIDEITTDTTYDKIVSTCTQVGRNCIVQACKSITGNFGLCYDPLTSVNRTAILDRTSCWDDVYTCVRSAGQDAIDKIFAQKLTTGKTNFYDEMYGEPPTGTNPNCIDAGNENKCVLDVCANECGNGNDATSFACRACRITERLWGNCEYTPNTTLTSNQHNMIRMPRNGYSDTLLAWFGKNTDSMTDNNTFKPDSCIGTLCQIGFTPCLTAQNALSCQIQSGDDTYTPNNPEGCEGNECFIVANELQNKCAPPKWDTGGNCCMSTLVASINIDENVHFNNHPEGTAAVPKVCLPGNNYTVVATFINDTDQTTLVICPGTTTEDTEEEISCSQAFIVITYRAPNVITYNRYTGTQQDTKMLYYIPSGDNYNAPWCSNTSDNNKSTACATPGDTGVQHYKIDYTVSCGQ